MYRWLVEGDVASTEMEASAHDLVIACLVDEHPQDLRPLYQEANRLAKPRGSFVLVGYHFIMSFGMPTHFNSASGEPLAIETRVHILSDQ